MRVRKNMRFGSSTCLCLYLSVLCLKEAGGGLGGVLKQVTEERERGRREERDWRGQPATLAVAV